VQFEPVLKIRFSATHAFLLGNVAHPHSGNKTPRTSFWDPTIVKHLPEFPQNIPSMEHRDRESPPINDIPSFLVGSLPDHCPRILSLDGGGVRGLSSLLIMRNIMEEIARRNGTAEARPCDYFDLIGGTGTGGLIAIMLGRLRMVRTWGVVLIWAVHQRMCQGIHRPIKESFRSRSGSERRNPRW
jgi:Patatin-like phospholipase